MKREQRAQRVARLIQETLAELIQREVKDPRVGPITITEVRVSSDLGHARVFCSSWLGAETLRTAVEALQHAAPFLRQQLGKRLATFRVPELHFVVDEGLERAIALTRLIDKLSKG